MRQRDMSMALLLAACVFLALPAANSSTVRSYPTAVVSFSDQAPDVDGQLNDASWQSATELGPFGDIVGAKAKGETRARVLRSGDVLFVGVTCKFAPGAKLTVNGTKRDSDVYTGECVEVFIDPDLSLRKYFHLLVNPANVQRDETGDKAGSVPYNVDWNGKWESATYVGEDEWTLEIAVPLSTLGLKPGKPALIGLNICRSDSTTGNLSCWSPTVSGFHEPVRFGVVSLPSRALDALVNVKLEMTQEPRLGRSQQAVQVSSGTSASLAGSFIAGNEHARTAGKFGIPKLDAGATVDASAGYTFQRPGDNALVIAASTRDGNVVGLAKMVFSLPEAIAQDYGYRIDGGEALGTWWAESTHKIHRETPVPTRASQEVYISAAGREYEAAQIVVRPEEDIELTATVSDFTGDKGTIDARNFSLHEVAYVPVSIPTDRFGWVGDWPDPIPPLEGPLHCVAGQNQPIWVLAYVPPGTRPGTYRGTVELAAGDTRVSVPVSLRVWGFRLTRETHMKTAYGCGPAYSFQGVTGPEQRKQVYDLYMQSFRDHRVAPYSPMANYPMDIKTLAPMRKYTVGRMAIEIERGQQYPWKLYWDGKQIASQRTSMTHFDGEGVGWEGTGLGWPYINAIQSITEVSNSASMKVLEVVGAHTGSGVAGRSFKLTFRVYLPAGDDWFGTQLVKFESTDRNETTVRNYFNIPRTELKAEQVANGPDFAAWSGEGTGFGMLRLGDGTAGPSVKLGDQGVTMGNAVAPFKTKAPDTHEGWGPLVIYFVTDKTSPADLTARAKFLRETINAAEPAKYTPVQGAQITVERRDDYTFEHDFTVFDEGAERYLDQFKFNAFNMRCMPGQIGGYPRFSEGYKRLHKAMYGPVIEHLREKGWLKYAYSYWYDEPGEDAYPFVIEGMSLLGEDCPGLTRLLTEQPEEPLHEVIDLWVPVLSMYREEKCHERQAAGDDVWWYVCCGPRAPYPNNFIDHPAINHRIRFWMAEKYGVTGSLYWATTFYGTDPETKKPVNRWEDAMTYRPSGGYWGNGDGMLIYPPCRKPSETPIIKGPVSSVRWELLRDGIEDYEYLWTLKQEIARLEGLLPGASRTQQVTIKATLKVARDALDAPNRLAESLIVFDKDPQSLLREREHIARTIEACRRIR